MESRLLSCKHSSLGFLSGRSLSGDLGFFCKPKTSCTMMAVKPKSHHNSVHDHKEVSTELALSCGFQNEASMESTLSCGFQNEVSTESLLSCGFQNEVSTESLLSCGFQNRVSMESCGFQKEVSTELMLSCGSQTKAKKLKACETSYSVVSLARNYELLTENPDDEGVSTALKLYDDSWINPKKTKALKNSAINSKEDNPVSDNPKVTLTALEDPWKIKKTLTDSDLGHLSRLLLRTNLVKDHVLPFLGTDFIREIETKGMRVTVWDQDSQSEHRLVFKKWPTSKSYVLIDMWHKDFVIRRNLKQGDVIGLYWDTYNSRFNFGVLQRAPVCESAL